MEKTNRKTTMRSPTLVVAIKGKKMQMLSQAKINSWNKSYKLNKKSYMSSVNRQVAHLPDWRQFDFLSSVIIWSIPMFIWSKICNVVLFLRAGWKIYETTNIFRLILIKKSTMYNICIIAFLKYECDKQAK